MSEVDVRENTINNAFVIRMIISILYFGYTSRFHIFLVFLIHSGHFFEEKSSHFFSVKLPAVVTEYRKYLVLEKGARKL